MAKIYAPNTEYTGVSASVPFLRGVGESNNVELLNWFREHGYTVEDEPKQDIQQQKTEQSKKG